jgi:hypothetical protein
LYSAISSTVFSSRSEKLNVHQHHVGAQLARKCDGVFTPGGMAGHRVAQQLQLELYIARHHHLIFHNQNLNRSFFRSWLRIRHGAFSTI